MSQSSLEQVLVLGKGVWVFSGYELRRPRDLVDRAGAGLNGVWRRMNSSKRGDGEVDVAVVLGGVDKASIKEFLSHCG